MKILVLLSGGIDSTVVLASLCKEHDCRAIGFNYMQPHAIELKWAAQIAKHYGISYETVPLFFIPLINDVVFAGRNMVFAATAAAIAQAEGYEAIAIGCNQNDWLRFPDCRPQFWSGIKQAAEAYGVEVLTPLLHTLKSDIVAWAQAHDVPLHLTWSCYSPQDGEPCGKCLACETRQAALWSHTA